MVQNGPFIRLMGFETKMKQVHNYFYLFDPYSVGPLFLFDPDQSNTVFQNLQFFNLSAIKLRFHLFYNDLILSAIHMHVCILYILSASSFI